MFHKKTECPTWFVVTGGGGGPNLTGSFLMNCLRKEGSCPPTMRCTNLLDGKHVR